MSKKNNEDYQEGFNDACEMYEAKYIKLEEIMDSINKFLDKINKLKNIINFTYDHFKNNKDINGKIFEGRGKKINLNSILGMIEEEKKRYIK